MANNLSQVISKHYSPAKPEDWQEKLDNVGIERYSRTIQCLDLTHGFPERQHKNAWAFIGFSHSEAENHQNKHAVTSPTALRKALSSLPSPGSDITLYDVGNVIHHDSDLQEAQNALKDVIYILLKSGIRPIILGDSYGIASGIFCSIESAFPTQDNAFIDFSSHLNLNKNTEENYESFEPSFAQIALEHIDKDIKFDFAYLGLQKHAQTHAQQERADDLKAKLIYADEFHIGGAVASIEIADAMITRNDNIFISVSLDVFASPFAPGVKEPQPLGLFPWHVIPVLRRLGSSGKVLCLDITGLYPKYDQEDATAALGAYLIADFIFHTQRVS